MTAGGLTSVIPLDDIAAGARFLRRLPSFLRHPIGSEEARAIVRRRLERREADFLTVVERLIYRHDRSPYRDLLRLAGCEYGDVERLVGREGVEGALRALYRQGVYLTVDEFKGRRPAIRGSATIAVDPGRLRNPGATVHALAQSSGSRGPRTQVPLDLASNWDHAINRRLSLDARNAIGWRHAIWGVPGGGEMVIVLRFAVCGAPPVHWFSQVDPAGPGLHPRYRWSGRVMRWGSLLGGVPLPSPRYVPLEDPLPIARWMVNVLRAGGTPHLKTFPSSAVVLCQAAIRVGIDLRGTEFTLTGEPLTAARLAQIRRAGAKASPDYGSTESGAIGEWCVAPEAPDDVHLFHDLQALIQPGADGQDGRLPPGALLISSLRLTAPLVMLNVSMGDQAVVVRRVCGCPMERHGWTTHLHTIRSFEKLTGEGMTFLDMDVIRVLEDILPARFGGAPTDYQLSEEESEDGHSRLRLLVHPEVGPLDEAAVVDQFLASIGGGSGAERVMELVWRQARLIRVERRAPHAQASGKILHLHLQRRDAAPIESRTVSGGVE